MKKSLKSACSYSVNEIYNHSLIHIRKETQNPAPFSILIVGKDSYIGTNTEKHLVSYGNFKIHTLDAVNLVPIPEYFKGYDAVFYVAGIVHQKESRKNISLYYKVNRDLAVSTAKSAKKANVPHFIILSSMSVYGAEAGHITKDSITNPANHYGKSKLEADCAIWKLRSRDFRVAILRPPMVYGRTCKGNYQLLRKLALLTPVFPQLSNERSMIYIGNLCEFVKNIIEKQREGIFFPQNDTYINTCEMVKQIAACHGKKIRETRLFNGLLKSIHLKVFKKLFGNLTYEKTDTIGMYNFEDSIKYTEQAASQTKRKERQLIRIEKLPPFSVLMSVYIGENPEHLQMSLQSILVNQTLKPNEVILICDGKLSRELDAVIHQFEKMFPDTLHVFRKQREGLGHALHYGLQQCTYDLVARADTDDICDRKRFEIQVRYMKSHPEVIVCSSYIDEFKTDWQKTGRIKKVPVRNKDIRQWAKYRNPINHMAAIYRKKPLTAIGSYRHVEGAEDYDLWVRAMSKKMKMSNIPKVLVHARTGNGMVKRRSNRKYIKTWQTIDRYMLKHHMMNILEYCCSMAGVRIFVYMPENAKEILYSKLLRKHRMKNFKY